MARMVYDPNSAVPRLIRTREDEKLFPETESRVERRLIENRFGLEVIAVALPKIMLEPTELYQTD